MIWFGFMAYQSYLKPKPVYSYTLDIDDFVWLGFMSYQPL